MIGDYKTYKNNNSLGVLARILQINLPKGMRGREMKGWLLGLAVGLVVFIWTSTAGDLSALERPSYESIEVEVSEVLLDEISAGFFTPALSDAGSKIILWDENGRTSDFTNGGANGTFIDVNEY